MVTIVTVRKRTNNKDTKSLLQLRLNPSRCLLIENNPAKNKSKNHLLYAKLYHKPIKYAIEVSAGSTSKCNTWYNPSIWHTITN